MTEPCDLSLREAADLIAAKRLSPVELTTSTLCRLDATEPDLRAYVAVFAEQARADARRAEVEIGADRHLGPLHGIPVGIKDIFDVAGVPTRCGSRLREDAPPAVVDAPTVARLRAAGAVPIGKTTTQEFAAGVVSAPARNPWDPARIPGGSSGGSAAAVAAGSCLAALGSDTGGSVRIPASVCGVVGLKPTYGVISKRGVFPLAWSLDTVGPLARSVEDAALLVDLLAGHDPLDPGSSPRQPASAAGEIGQTLAGLRIGVPRPFFFDRLQRGVAEIVETALAVLAGLGAEVIEAPWPEAGAARATGFVINRVESTAVHGAGIRRDPDRYGEELRLRLETNALMPAETYLRALRARGLLKRSIARLFADHRLDALAVPATPGTAVPADDLSVTYDDGGREPVMLAYTRLTMPFNATGQPALSVPCGFDADGLPVGLQIVGRPFAEARVCRIGHAFERESGWAARRPPTLASMAR